MRAWHTQICTHRKKINICRDGKYRMGALLDLPKGERDAGCYISTATVVIDKEPLSVIVILQNDCSFRSRFIIAVFVPEHGLDVPT